MEAAAPDRRLAGRYLLESLIATGGMAQVWRARDEVLARVVAVKILRPELADDPAVAKRFQREAIAAARLTHPNIVGVFDTGEEDEARFIVMEHVPGRSLREVLDDEGVLPPDRAVELTLPILSALGYAHEQGIVHRDVKPGNVLVADDDSRVKVTDFGIAKAAYGRHDLTTTGAMLGTVRYLSPEQVEGDTPEPRSDLYSMGVVLYEMITGRPPFQAETDVATAMVRLTTDPLPPRAIRPGIPKHLEAAVLRAMARRPEDRFPSAAAMQDALERHRAATPNSTSVLPSVPRAGRTDGHSPAPRRERSAFRSWMLVPLILVLLAAATLAGGLALGRLEIGGPLLVRPVPKGSAAGGSGEATVRILRTRDFDPNGDGEENGSAAPLAIDGDPSTAWTTDHYNTADFGRLKDGLGLWLDLGAERDVQKVVVRSSLAGWTFQVRPGPFGQPGGALASGGGQSSFTVGPSGRVTLTLPSTHTQGLLIWITSLAPDDGRFAAAVAEVTVQGPA